MEKANIFGKMDIIMKENGKIVKKKEKGNLFGIMEIFMRENGKII